MTRLTTSSAALWIAVSYLVAKVKSIFSLSHWFNPSDLHVGSITFVPDKKTVFLINGYYYANLEPQAICPTNQTTVNATLSKIDAFKKAFSTLQLDQ